ncbi:MAG: mannose-1-phosphate guanylyltransferase [Cyclobacteriaceae bacterium]
MRFEDKYVVIMAGGIGSRVWPMSRKNTPKQFQDVLGLGRTMIQQTFDRYKDYCPQENVYVVTTTSYVDQVKEQLPELSNDQILGEPVGKNTAPCIAYAAHKINKKNPNAVMVVAPSDHLIVNTTEFVRCIELGSEVAANEDVLLTIGIKPTRPDTGYGYVQFADQFKEEIHKVKTFTEKPVLDFAIAFVESGEYLWNAGIFIWSSKAILRAFDHLLKDVNELFKLGEEYYYTTSETKFLKETYPQCKNISIDYGVMEHAENVYVIPGDFGWTDLGTWKACYDVADKDKDENVLYGEVMTYSTSNCLIKAPKDKLVVAHGLDGYVVVDHENVLLICKKEEEQKVKNFVADIKTKKLDKFY